MVAHRGVSIQTHLDTTRRLVSRWRRMERPVDVFVPEENVGDVIGDLNRRRGMIKSQEQGATNIHIKADVPLSEMFGYIGDLRSTTSGRGQFSMEFSHYAPVPNNIVEKVREEVKAREEAKN